MGKDILFTTETDGLCKHKVVSKKFIHLFPNMLEFNMRIPGANENLNLLINHGVPVPEQITKLNGITNELIAEQGSDPFGSMKLIETLIQDGDRLISHNVAFHLKVLQAFYLRMDKKFPKVETVCLQELGTDICKIYFNPEEPEEGRYKKPSLPEMKELFNIPEQADKMDAIAAIYEHMKGTISEQKPVKPASF